VEPAHRERLEALLAREHVAVLVTQGEQWPTATMQAFAETPELDLIFIMQAGHQRFKNLVARPNVSVFVDDRCRGDIASFKVSRVTIQGVATQVPSSGDQWAHLKKLFLWKNPFEAPFFELPMLKMVRVTPRHISYAGARGMIFKAEL